MAKNRPRKDKKKMPKNKPISNTFHTDASALHDETVKNITALITALDSTPDNSGWKKLYTDLSSKLQIMTGAFSDNFKRTDIKTDNIEVALAPCMGVYISVLGIDEIMGKIGDMLELTNLVEVAKATIAIFNSIDTLVATMNNSQ